MEDYIATPIVDPQPESLKRTYLPENEEDSTDYYIEWHNMHILNLNEKISTLVEDKLKSKKCIKEIHHIGLVTELAEKFNPSNFDLTKMPDKCTVILYKYYDDLNPQKLVGNEALLYNQLAKKYKYIRMSNDFYQTYDYCIVDDDIKCLLRDKYDCDMGYDDSLSGIVDVCIGNLPEEQRYTCVYSDIPSLKLLIDYIDILPHISSSLLKKEFETVTDTIYFQYDTKVQHGKRLDDWNNSQQICDIRSGRSNAFVKKNKLTVLECWS
uniref:Uncharacterized protein n=1 Tax=viral metagenome TaxID=1070528 RepID=A0A6C0ED72_9ZZZZ